ncbi:uncharacterized protein LOC128560708 [Nycticebus coucang]|uniref:uncharacterized protein LOC128560708 n=1 Tax=Nycticebus coucang TaxID=9470 RepID=UPI00234E2584|nr:uncharacterized protein LOC128560708 [Nycticebus coucang]
MVFVTQPGGPEVGKEHTAWQHEDIPGHSPTWRKCHKSAVPPPRHLLGVPFDQERCGLKAPRQKGDKDFRTRSQSDQDSGRREAVWHTTNPAGQLPIGQRRRKVYPLTRLLERDFIPAVDECRGAGERRGTEERTAAHSPHTLNQGYCRVRGTDLTASQRSLLEAGLRPPRREGRRLGMLDRSQDLPCTFSHNLGLPEQPGFQILCSLMPYKTAELIVLVPLKFKSLQIQGPIF